MDEPVPIDPERLLAQTAWVRRLARSLARDEASADDLVQETFVAALRRPPGGAVNDGRLRAWFGFVLRNMAIRRTRSEVRRVEREQRSLDAGRTDSDERAEELEQLRAELFHHVKALAEPARQVVLLHYFEELDSAEIARRLGVPNSTVRNRLKRALAELRERLEREHGPDWRNLCLFVLPSTGAKVALGGGTVVAAAGGLWIAGSALGLAALVLVLWIAMQSAGPESEHEMLSALPVEIPQFAAESDSRAAGGRTPSSSPGADMARIVEAGALRISVTDSYEPPPTTPYAHGIIVFGTVRDEQGEPLENVSMRWTDPWGRVRSSQTQEGKYDANSFGPGVHVVCLFGRGCGPVVREITIAPEPELQEFNFTERRARLVPIYVEDLDGRSLIVAEADRGLLFARGGGAVMMHRPPGAAVDSWFLEDAPRPDWSGVLETYAFDGSPPAGAFGVIQIGGEPPYFVSLLRASRVLSTQRFDVIPERVAFPVARSDFDPRPIVESTQRTFVMVDGVTTEVFRPGVLPTARRPVVSVHLQFLDSNARPVMARFKLAPVSAEVRRFLASDQGPLTWSWTAHADGTRVVEDLPPGMYELSVVGTANDDDRTPPNVGALPRRIELKSSGDNEVLVGMSPTRDVLLRSRCAADEVFVWEIRTQDELPVARGKLVGHAPSSLRLPAGEFMIRVRSASSQPVLAEECFPMAESPLVIELTR